MRQPRKMTLLSFSILALLSRIMTDGGVRCGRLLGHRTIYYPHHALLPIFLTDDPAMIILSRTIQKHFSNVGEGSFLCRGNKGDGVMLGFCLILLSPHPGTKTLSVQNQSSDMSWQKAVQRFLPLFLICFMNRQAAS